MPERLYKFGSYHSSLQVSQNLYYYPPKVHEHIMDLKYNATHGTRLFLEVHQEWGTWRLNNEFNIRVDSHEVNVTHFLNDFVV